MLGIIVAGTVAGAAFGLTLALKFQMESDWTPKARLPASLIGAGVGFILAGILVVAIST